jgi:hypothetical protein
MIFKKSKVLTDNIVDPVPGKSHRGHFTKLQHHRGAGASSFSYLRHWRPTRSLHRPHGCRGDGKVAYNPDSIPLADLALL